MILKVCHTLLAMACVMFMVGAQTNDVACAIWGIMFMSIAGVVVIGWSHRVLNLHHRKSP